MVVTWSAVAGYSHNVVSLAALAYTTTRGRGQARRVRFEWLDGRALMAGRWTLELPEPRGKEQPGERMDIGGPTLAASAVRLALVDEYRLLVQPVVLGSGTPYFPTLDEAIELELLETCRFGSGVVYLRYRVNRC